jgi:hypothetical protein
VKPAREEGMARAVLRADCDSPRWSDHALTIVKAWCRIHKGERAIAEVIIAYAHDTCGLPKPADTRAWGGVIKRAAREGRLLARGFTSEGTNNSSPKILWEAA